MYNNLLLFFILFRIKWFPSIIRDIRGSVYCLKSNALILNNISILINGYVYFVVIEEFGSEVIQSNY